MKRPTPQDVPQDGVPFMSFEEQVNALEQALSVQISKRIESETHMKSLASTENELYDLKEILNSFIFEVDGLDGDESESLMKRKDVLWFLKELHQRVSDIIVKLQMPPTVHAKVEEETNIAKLQGQVSSMKEIIDSLRSKSRMANDESDESLDAKDEDKRHEMIEKEMKESISDKNREISNLRNQLQQCCCDIHGENIGEKIELETRFVAYDSPTQSGVNTIKIDSPLRNSLIQSLREDVEDKNRMIQDLTAELDRAKQQLQRLTNSEESLRIHYLERIIRDYERKLSPNARYGTIGFYAPETMDADDIELRIAELTEQLKQVNHPHISDEDASLDPLG